MVRLELEETKLSVFTWWKLLLFVVVFMCAFWSWWVIAAPVSIDTVATVVNSNIVTGGQTVFVSDQVGYTFYRDNTPNNGRCVYSKTIDGGQTWDTPVRIDGQSDCIKVVVWYDQWTPGNTGSNIHIVTLDTGDDDVWYNRLDTTSDTRLLGESPVNITASLGYSGAVTEAANTHSVTVATDGVIYAAVSDNSDSIIVSCSSNCDINTNWIEVGTPGTLPNATDHNLLMPLSSGSILLINRNISPGLIRSRVWNGTVWGSWSTIDSAAGYQPLFPGAISATLDHVSGNIYLLYAADNDNFSIDDHDIRTAVFDGSTWSSMTDVITNAPGRGLHSVAAALDSNTGAVYAMYTIRTSIGSNTSGNVYYKVSNDGMLSWGSEQGPLNVSSGNLYGPFSNVFSNERIYAAWYDPATNERFGETVADIGPDTIVGVLGSQESVIRAGETLNLNSVVTISSVSNRTITAITLTETGTIDAANDIAAIALYYDLDTSAPYDCVSESFGGNEIQFAATSTSGFSGGNGTLTFTGSTITVNPTQTICIYPIVTTSVDTFNGATLALSIGNPETDVVVSGTDAYPNTAVLFGSTTVVSPVLTQTYYHWRNDDGNEIDATSATAGVENSPLVELTKNSPRRLRMQVSTEGSTTSKPTTLQLEYGSAAPSCSEARWTSISTTSTEWQLYDSSFFVDGENTTNISASANGALTDANTIFLSSNAALRDQTNPITALTLATTSFVEVEFSLVANIDANDGETYCFRLTDAGDPLSVYEVYPSATLASDVLVSTIGSLVTESDIPSLNTWLGSTFVISERSSSRQITEITITETGTIDAQNSLANVKLFYDLDTTAPYDCADQSYSGTEAQFGTTMFDGFNAANGTTTFTDSVSISTSSSLCVYVIADIQTTALNAQTISLEISNPSTDVGISGGGSVAPTTPVVATGVVTLSGSVVTQTGYHWRNNDGDELTATSLSGGADSTPISEVIINTPVRLRLGIANTGATTSPSVELQLEYGLKITDCDLVSVWTPVDAAPNDDWDMVASAFLSHGTDATDITVTSGGVTNGNSNFISSNNGIRTTVASVPALQFTESEFTEIEFSIKSSLDTAYNTTYCFRVTDGGTALPAYENYAELTTAPKRDFKVQRGSVTIATSTVTISAGDDYDAPIGANRAFIRITNSHHTGAGNDSGGGVQNADDVTAYIVNPNNLQSSIMFAREGSVSDTTYIDWEIVEFIGVTGTDNEMIVRDVGTISMNGSQVVATGSVSTVTDTSDVVVFITGIKNAVTNRNYYTGQVTSEWSPQTGVPVFTRAIADNAAIEVSYAVVEYTGVNWRVQRVEHSYEAAGTTETTSITPVGSLNRSFLHTQKRMGADNTVAGLGHTVWLSSIGAVSFLLDSGAVMAVSHTAVVWVIENTQLGGGALQVQRLNGTTIGGSEPRIESVSLPTPVAAFGNSSVFVVTSADVANTAHPRVYAGAKLASTTALQLWRSDSGSTLTYRAEVVEWPVAQLAQRQTHYRWFVDNNLITPVDPWSSGALDLGENTSITRSDDPPGISDVLRLRIAVRVANANMPAGYTAYQLEYAERVTTCSAVPVWSAVGNTASSAAWRGYAATGTIDGAALSTNPSTPGDLLLSVSSVAGRLTHQNPSLANLYSVPEGGAIELDWYIQQNNAAPSTVYCFRMVQSDETPLDQYLVYPEVRTAGFSPAASNWRWYSDPETITPTLALALENVTPINISVGDTIALRLAVTEEKGIDGIDARFRLQFDEDIDFDNPIDVVASSTCTLNSLWCFIDGANYDGNVINSALISNSDLCVNGSGNGCGTQHASTNYLTGHTHGARVTQEYSFTLQHAGARTNAVYYFRLYDLVNDEPVPLVSGASYPSLLTESASLAFTISGLPVGSVIAGQVVSATSTPSTISFGSLPISGESVAAQRLSVTTNATQGYQVFSYVRQPLLDSSGNSLLSISASNSAPVSWSLGCQSTTTSCVGYHTTDPTLAGGSTRFAALDTYAGLHPDLTEIMYSSIPVAESHDILYRLQVGYLQPPGEYETGVVYIAVPVH